MNGNGFVKENETDEAALLEELRAISNRSSALTRFEKKKGGNGKANVKANDAAERQHENNYNGEENASDTEGQNRITVDSRVDNDFIACNPENSVFNQYWYSSATIQVLTDTLKEIMNSTNTKRVAFLSVPSLYFALSAEDRSHCKVFEIDRVWSSDAGYVYYDFNKPEEFDSTLRKSFDIVVVDPPFISIDVWKKYAITVKLLLKNDPLGEAGEKGIVLAATVAENKGILNEMFGVQPTTFKPVCPNLIYQFYMYTNCPEHCTLLNKPNPEVPDD